MTPAAALALVACALGVVVVRRRAAAVALVAVQSLILAALALGDGIGHSAALALAGAALIVKGLALPALLAWIVVRTPEPRLIVEERHALARAGAAIGLALVLVVLLPPLGLTDRTTQDTAVALLAIGVATALLRRAAIFHVLGFLVAENGVYAAALGTPDGLPALIEVGLIFDLFVVISVAALFSARIHEQLGTADTGLLKEIRD
jgi:hydrogenase-4 component E